VLARGEKGTAKSTMVRGLANVLPEIDVVPGCRFSCDPAAPDRACADGPHNAEGSHSGLRPTLPTSRRAARVEELPVGATEDRLVGSLDLERALADGVKAYEPGLLAAAHRGVLYVDEVNLLHDHLVDLLLDAAALGRSYVERDGVSLQHASRFLLVGTMNPEEGELRPQLLDRFGLTVEVAAPRDPRLRAEVVRRRLAYDSDPSRFEARFADDEARLARQIEDARGRLTVIELSDGALRRIARVCAEFDVDGLRADIVIARAAVAHAAWSGRTAVTRDDVRVAARLALPHRRRRNPFDAPGLDEDQLDAALDRADQAAADDEPEPDLEPDSAPAVDSDVDPDPDLDPDPSPDGGGGDEPPGDPSSGTAAANDGAATDNGAAADGSSRQPGSRTESSSSDGDDQSSESRPADEPGPIVVAPVGAARKAQRIEVPGLGEGAAGRRSRAVGDGGHVTRAETPRGRLRRLHLTATIAAAAPHQLERGRRGPGLLVHRADLRDSRLEGRESNLVLFVVDASGSMAARRRMSAVKGAVMSLLLDAYQRRDKVGLITFRGASATLALPPTSSVDAAAARLEALPTGGRTPLAAGLELAFTTLERERLRDPRRRPLLVIVTDGRRTAGDDPVRVAAALAGRGTACVVIDCESGPVRLGLAGELATRLRAVRLELDDLVGAEALADTVRDIQGARSIQGGRGDRSRAEPARTKRARAERVA
jgi:magnesium chelatase subunit D